MSVHKTHFQALPEHIIESIVLYVIDCTTDDSELYKRVGLSLAHTCHRWRTIYIRHICSAIHLNVSLGELVCELARLLSWYKNPTDLPLANIAKTVVIHLDFTYFYSRHNIVDKFLESEFARYELAKVKNVDIWVSVVDFSYVNGNQVYGYDELCNAIRQLDRLFVHIRKMMPHVQDMRISWIAGIDSADGYSVSKQIGQCIARVIQGLRIVKINDFSNSVDFIALDTLQVCNLTRLEFNYRPEHQWGLELVWRNSETLYFLGIDMLPGSLADSLLFNDRGQPVVYPCLETLDIFFMSEQAVDTRQNNKLVHFPELRKLALSGEIVCCKAFFRDCGDVLEHISIEVNDLGGDAFINLGAILMSCCNFKHLRTAIINSGVSQSAAIGSQMQSVRGGRLIDALKTMTLKTNYLSYLSYSAQTNANVIQNLLNSSEAFIYLQKLALITTYFNFQQLTRLLQTLPQLQLLKCSLKNEILTVDLLELPQMADHVATTIYPLHRALLKADLFACADDLSENMVQMLGLLVIGCPRLLDITPARLSKLPELLKILLKLSESQEFSKYSDRLKWVVAKNKLNK